MKQRYRNVKTSVKNGNTKIAKLEVQNEGVERENRDVGSENIREIIIS